MGCNQSKYVKKTQRQELQVVPKHSVEYRIDEGRRFHNIENAKYFLPNDDDELDRLHLQHYLWRFIWQSNYSAPVENLLKSENVKVLDVGCGAGSWLFELATEYSQASFIGVDICPVIPLTIKPRNIDFIQMNALDGLVFEDNTFDFVYQRLLVGAYASNKWQEIVNELVRVLKPGGYLELMEVNAETPAMGPITKRLCDAVMGFMIQRGQDPHVYKRIKSFMETNEQLEGIVEEERFGPFSKKNSRLCQIAIENHIALYTSLKPNLLRTMNISSEDYEELLKIMAEELSDYESHLHTIRVYGRKKL